MPAVVSRSDRSLEASSSDDERATSDRMKSTHGRHRPRKRKRELDQLAENGISSMLTSFDDGTIATAVDDDVDAVVETNTNRGVTCPSCGLKFRSKSTKYFKHIQVHTNETLEAWCRPPPSSEEQREPCL